MVCQNDTVVVRSLSCQGWPRHSSALEPLTAVIKHTGALSKAYFLFPRAALPRSVRLTSTQPHKLRPSSCENSTPTQRNFNKHLLPRGVHMLINHIRHHRRRQSCRSVSELAELFVCAGPVHLVAPRRGYAAHEGSYRESLAGRLLVRAVTLYTLLQCCAHIICC
jgi:hypothetical protein